MLFYETITTTQRGIIINTTFLQRIPIINLGFKHCIVPAHRRLFRCHGSSDPQQRRVSSRAGRWRDITGWGKTIRITSTAELIPQFMLHLWPTRDCLPAGNSGVSAILSQHRPDVWALSLALRFYSFIVGIDFRRQIWRQILTSKVNTRTERINKLWWP